MIFIFLEKNLANKISYISFYTSNKKLFFEINYYTYKNWKAIIFKTIYIRYFLLFLQYFIKAVLINFYSWLENITNIYIYLGVIFKIK